MRNILLLLFLAINYIHINAQDWVRQHPFSVHEQLTEITFDELGRGWTVGSNSTILHTTNWGIDWEIQQPINFGIALLSVEIVPNSNGQKAFIGGNTLLRTDNGGENWEQVFGFTNPIDQILAVDEQTIYAFGYNDTSRKSIDGGDTWIEFPNPAEGGTMIGSFIDPLNGWASGGTYQNAQVYRTNDGGQSWSLLDTTRHVVIQNITMLDALNGFMASSEHIFKTIDGGSTWTTISDQSLPSLTDFHVVNEQQLWACMNNGSVYSTFNGGDTWTLDYPDVFNGNSSRGIHATTGGQAWIAGKYASVLYTADTGQSWQDLTPGNKNSLQDIHFYDDDNGFSCGFDGTLLKTVDGGAIWQDISLPTDDLLYSLQMTGPQTLYVLTNQGDVLKSINGGQSWTVVGDDLSSSSEGIVVINDQHICTYTQFGKVYVTMDGGTMWTEVINDGRAYDISFSSDDTGWIASSDGNILKTIDGGLTWNPIHINNDDDFHTVHFIDDMEGWVTGRFVDSLFHTTDGGLNWETQYLPSATYWQEISFMDRDTGWIAGGSSGQSKIMKTTDGGQNWEQVYSDAAQLRGLTSLSSNKAWAAGSGGNIVHFSPCNALPELSNLIGAQQLCEGDTVQYQVNSENVTIFNWQLPNDWTFLSNSNTGLIEVLVGNEQGDVQLIGQNSCESSSDPISLAVTVENATDLNLNVSDNNILDVSPTGQSYTWYLNNEIIHQSSSNTYSALQSGLYHVIVTFATGCSATSDIVNVMVTGSNEIAIQNAIEVFPNPTRGVFQLNLPIEITNAQISILDSTARPLMHKNINRSNNLDLSGFDAGIYYLKIKSDQGIFYKRVLII